MESGALRTKTGRRFKGSSIDTARESLEAFRNEFGGRTSGSITRVEAEDLAERVSPSKLPIVITLMNDLYCAEVIDSNRFERPESAQRGPHERAATEQGGDGSPTRRLLGTGRRVCAHDAGALPRLVPSRSCARPSSSRSTGKTLTFALVLTVARVLSDRI
jgi:hypothetical protein